MNTFTPACEKDTGENFEISAVVNDIDDSNGEVMIEITHNLQCTDCPLIQECVSRVVAITEEAFDLEEWDVQIPTNLN